MFPFTPADASLVVSLVTLSGVLYANRGGLPLRRAQTRQAEASADNLAVESMKTALETVQEDNKAVHSELASVRERLTLISRWVAGLPRHLVPDEIRAALREDGAPIRTPASAGDD